MTGSIGGWSIEVPVYRNRYPLREVMVVSAVSRILGLDVQTDGISDIDTSMFWSSPLEHGPVPVTYSNGCVGIEWYGLTDDPEAVSKIELRDAEAKRHGIIHWCRDNKIPINEYRKP